MTARSPPIQLVVFIAVGIVATATHTTFALVSHQIGGLAPMTANLIGYASAVLVSYVGNARFTFRRPLLAPAQFLRFVVISLLALALNETLVFIFTRPFHMPFYVALIPVVLVVPVFSFTISRLWAFMEKPAAAAVLLNSPVIPD